MRSSEKLERENTSRRLKKAQCKSEDFGKWGAWQAGSCIEAVAMYEYLLFV